jgi:PAS domain S-box-containing protein
MGAPIRVLHVDDDEDFTAASSAVLERENERLTVETATDADSAMEVLHSERVDCIVSDHEMPGRSGIEFLRWVREEWPELPFILFTGKGSEEIASEAISAGVSDYFQKRHGADQYAVLANKITNVVDSIRAQRTQQRQLDAIEAAQEGISILDDEGAFVYVNEAYAELYGYDPGELVGEHWERLYRDEDTPYIREEILPQVDEAGHWHGTTTGVRSDGTTFVEDHVLAQTEQGGLVCTVRDAGDRAEAVSPQQQNDRLKQEIERRKATETRYRSLFENSPIVVWEEDLSAAKAYVDDLAAEVDDLEEYLADHPEELEALVERTKIIDINETAVEHYGAESKQDLIDNIDRILTDESWEELGALWTAVANGETSVRMEGEIKTLDGERREQILELHVPEAYADDYSRAYITETDITERRERERELRRQNERLNEFTSVVSHDLRNPLNAAGLRLDLAREECNSEHLAIAEQNVERMERLIDDLLALARAGQTADELESVDLAALARSCWQNVVTDDATLEIDDEVVVRADRSRLQQLLENLYRNAIEHGGADVTVAVGSLEGGFYVEDDGPGIPPGEREAAFESGYSTAENGTGFGLQIVEQIADAHGWRVQVTAAEDGGARFEVTPAEPAR